MGRECERRMFYSGFLEEASASRLSVLYLRLKGHQTLTKSPLQLKIPSFRSAFVRQPTTSCFPEKEIIRPGFSLSGLPSNPLFSFRARHRAAAEPVGLGNIRSQPSSRNPVLIGFQFSRSQSESAYSMPSWCDGVQQIRQPSQ